MSTRKTKVGLLIELSTMAPLDHAVLNGKVVVPHQAYGIPVPGGARAGGRGAPVGEPSAAHIIVEMAPGPSTCRAAINRHSEQIHAHRRCDSVCVSNSSPRPHTLMGTCGACVCSGGSFIPSKCTFLSASFVLGPCRPRGGSDLAHCRGPKSHSTPINGQLNCQLLERASSMFNGNC